MTFGLRPEHLGIASPSPGDGETVRVNGRVVLVEPLGSDTLGLVKLGERDDAGEMTGRFPPDAALAPGSSIPATLSLSKFHLFDPQSGAAIRGAGW